MRHKLIEIITVRKSKWNTLKKAVAVRKAAAAVDVVNVAANQCLFSAVWSALDSTQQDLVTVRWLFNGICSDELN